MRIDFYLFKQTTITDCYQTVCRIIAKAYQQGHLIILLCVDNSQAQIIDKLLWTFQETSFLPHQLVSAETDQLDQLDQTDQTDQVVAPILITTNSANTPDNYDILVNLGFFEFAPRHFKQFQRISEIVPATEEALTQARQRYRIYRQQGCTIHSHQLLP